MTALSREERLYDYVAHVGSVGNDDRKQDTIEDIHRLAREGEITLDVRDELCGILLRDGVRTDIRGE